MNSYGEFLCKHKNYGLFLKVFFSCTFQKHCKTYPQISSFNLTASTLENVQIPSSELYINSYANILTEPTSGAKIFTSEKFQFHI